MAMYGLEKQAYANDLEKMVEEPPLAIRLETILVRLRHVLDVCTELQHGPQPEANEPSGPMPELGVLNLGVQLEKLSMAVENEIMVIHKRIGRL